MRMKFGEIRQEPASRRLWAARWTLVALAMAAGAVVAVALATSLVILPLVLVGGLAIHFLAWRQRPAPKPSSRNLVIETEYTVIRG